MSPALHPLSTLPWPPIIGVYFILTGIAAGTSLVAEWLRPRDEHAAVTFSWRLDWLALGALGLCGVILIIDLGRPERFVLMLTSLANPGSAMSIGAKLLALKGFLLLLYLYLLYRRRQAMARGDMSLAPGLTQTTYTVIPALLAIASLCLAAYPAILLSRTWFAPLATGAGAALLFVTTALLMGIALALLVTREAEHAARLRGTMLFLAGAHLCLLLLSGLSLYDGPPALERALHSLMAGQSAGLFWGLVIGVGLGLPCIALVVGWRQPASSIVSALGLFIGAATLRWLFFSVV